MKGLALKCLFLVGACLLARVPVAGAQQSEWETCVKAAQEARAKKDYAEVEQQLLAAHKIAKKWGESSLRFGYTLYWLGEVYAARAAEDPKAAADWAKAERYISDGLEILEKRLGREHLDVATALETLGGVYGRPREKTPAAPLRGVWEEASAVRLEPPGAVPVANYAKAKTLYERALAIREKQQGADQAQTLAMVDKLADLHYAHGDTAAAMSLYTRLFENLEKRLGPTHPGLSHYLGLLGMVSLAEGKFAGAQSIFERRLRLFQRAPDLESWRLREALENAADAYRLDNKCPEAYPLYRAAIESLTAADAINLPLLENYAKCLNTLGRTEEAKQIEDRAKADAQKLEEKRKREASPQTETHLPQ